MAKPMKMRELQRRLQVLGCKMRQGKGRHIIVYTPNGRHIAGTLQATATEVGAGTVIAMERALGVDLDDKNPRWDRLPLNVAVSAPLPRTRRKPVLAGPPKVTTELVAGGATPSPPPETRVTPPAPALTPETRVQLVVLLTMVNRDPMGIHLREEKGLLYLTVTKEAGGKLRRVTYQGDSLGDCLEQAAA